MNTPWSKVAGVVSVLAFPAFAFAGTSDLHLDAQLKCANTIGNPVVNVTVKVSNNADSGIAGNYWAMDALERHITVWQTATAGTFCATVKDEGSFRTIAGQTSPGATGTLTGKERGQINGGYVATVAGSLLANPLWKTHGNIGKIDYQCDAAGNCPGYVSWLSRYFNAGYGFDQPWWGWIYRGGKYGTWVNAVSGNSGDILPAIGTGEGRDSDGQDN